MTSVTDRTVSCHTHARVDRGTRGILASQLKKKKKQLKILKRYVKLSKCICYIKCTYSLVLN